MLLIRHCKSAADFSQAIDLTRTYVRWLDVDLCFQDIETELSNFTTLYAPPQGLYLLAYQDEELAGGVGLRAFAPGICEMKRLFVHADFRGSGIGRKLCLAIIEAAKKFQYQQMRLDTLERLGAAVRLYEDLGFYQIEGYRFNPESGVRYMELCLDRD